MNFFRFFRTDRCLTAVFLLLLLGVGCTPEESSQKQDHSGQSSIEQTGEPAYQVPPVYSGEFPAWDSLRSMLLPGWGKTLFWENKQEECAYYETRFFNGQKLQWESISRLKRETFPAPVGSPQEELWCYQMVPSDSSWPVLQGWFGVNPFPKPRSWSRYYKGVGSELFGNPATLMPYGVRLWKPLMGQLAIPQEEQPIGEGILMADQLPFMLRTLAFNPGNRIQLKIYPHPRRAMTGLANPLTLTLTVEGSETIQFLGEDFNTWKVTLRAGGSLVESYWFNRQYPNVMVRWENMAGESRMLKYVRYEDSM